VRDTNKGGKERVSGKRGTCYEFKDLQDQSRNGGRAFREKEKGRRKIRAVRI